jgi:hypothetical protein
MPSNQVFPYDSLAARVRHRRSTEEAMSQIAGGATYSIASAQLGSVSAAMRVVA